MKPHRPSRLAWRTFFLCAALVLPAAAQSAPAATPVISITPAATDTNSVDILRAYVQLQEQLHTALLAIEHNRQEADAAATRNAEALAARMQALQDSLAAQRSKELDELRGANRLMLIVGGSCAAIGFLAMLLTAYFQWRAITRLTEFSMVTQASLTMGRAALPALSGDGQSAGSAVEQAAARMFGALEKMEQRIQELEHTTGATTIESATTHTASSEQPAPAAKSERIHVLVAKGQSLLSLDQTEDALECFDQILAVDPNHTDTLVKKGEAIERLRRPDEAILCYDQAIAADQSMTIAYLHKGGLFNRMERYEEALKCYEQALHTQEKSQVA
ncbi:MAG: tetratricopeptide repeat protein [Pedosphaera sp.]|nr:tetratricopeptide repeat protein [Pedosphaera sp.]